MHIFLILYLCRCSQTSLTPSSSIQAAASVSRPLCLNSINSQRTLFASEYQSACVCVPYPRMQALNTLCECVQVCNVLRCLHASMECVCGCVRACKFCAPLFSLFPCSCAPLNMSDVLERDITTGAEREASSLSSPSPLYITSY